MQRGDPVKRVYILFLAARHEVMNPTSVNFITVPALTATVSILTTLRHVSDGWVSFLRAVLCPGQPGNQQRELPHNSALAVVTSEPKLSGGVFSPRHPGLLQHWGNV